MQNEGAWCMEGEVLDMLGIFRIIFSVCNPITNNHDNSESKFSSYLSVQIIHYKRYD